MGVYTDLEGEYYHHWSRPTSAVLMVIDTQAPPKCAVLLVSAYLLSDAVNVGLAQARPNCTGIVLGKCRALWGEPS